MNSTEVIAVYTVLMALWCVIDYKIKKVQLSHLNMIKEV